MLLYVHICACVRACACVRRSRRTKLAILWELCHSSPQLFYNHHIAEPQKNNNSQIKQINTVWNEPSLPLYYSCKSCCYYNGPCNELKEMDWDIEDWKVSKISQLEPSPTLWLPPTQYWCYKSNKDILGTVPCLHNLKSRTILWISEPTILCYPMSSLPQQIL